MKNIFMILIVLFSTGLSAKANESSSQEKEDYYVIFSQLLGINENRHVYIDNAGTSWSDELRAFKELEAIYGRYIEADKDGHYEREQVKVIMLLAFYAVNRGAAAMNEYLASDLKPIYAKNRRMFLDIMGELPFLIPSVCNRLNIFFGFEGKHTQDKPQFLSNNIALFDAHLTKQQSQLCLAQFRKN